MARVAGPVRRRAAWMRPWWPAIILWAAPLVAFAVLLPIALGVEAATVAAPKPDAVPVVERVRDLRVSVVAELALGPESVTRSGIGGTVTGIFVTRGTELADGAPVISVNGITVLAQLGAAPFYRAIGPGTRGADVAELHAYLGRIGIADVSGDRYTSATARAIRTLQQNLGATTDGVFTPALVAFVPPGGAVVHEVRVTLGDPVVPGGELVVSDRPVAGVAIRPADDRRTLLGFGTQPIRITAGELAADFAALTDLDLAAFTGFVGKATAAGEASATDEGDVRTVSGLVLALRDPVRAGAVPAQALLAQDGSVCVFVIDEGESPTPRPVDASATASNEIGVALVPARLIGQSVVLDPSGLSEEVRSGCG